MASQTRLFRSVWDKPVVKQWCHWRVLYLLCRILAGSCPHGALIGSRQKSRHKKIIHGNNLSILQGWMVQLTKYHRCPLATVSAGWNTRPCSRAISQLLAGAKWARIKSWTSRVGLWTEAFASFCNRAHLICGSGWRKGGNMQHVDCPEPTFLLFMHLMDLVLVLGKIFVMRERNWNYENIFFITNY